MKTISDFTVDLEEYPRAAIKSVRSYDAAYRFGEIDNQDYRSFHQVLFRGNPTRVIILARYLVCQFELVHGFLLMYAEFDYYDDYRHFVYLDRSLKIRDTGTLKISNLQNVPGAERLAAQKSGEEYSAYLNLEIVDDRTVEFDIVPRGRYRLRINEKPNLIWSWFRRSAWLRPWGAKFRGDHMHFVRVGPWRYRREVLAELNAKEIEAEKSTG